MGIRAWFRRSKNTRGQGPPPQVKRSPSGTRRRKANTRQRPGRLRGEQYDSDFITRYGDPFD
jgi:hypothetical protein